MSRRWGKPTGPVLLEGWQWLGAVPSRPDAHVRVNQALGLSIPCMVSQLTKALNQPVLVVSLGYMPKP
jgi:hypothetical protein